MMNIKLAVEKLKGNIDEAERLEMEALRLQATDKPLADWYHMMAQEHLKFNPPGHTVLEKMINETKSAKKDSPMMPGMLARYNDDHAVLVASFARVKSLIDNYAK